MLTVEKLEQIWKFTDTDAFRTLGARMIRAKELAHVEGGVFNDYLSDPRVTEIRVEGNKLHFGFDLLAKKAGVRK